MFEYPDLWTSPIPMRNKDIRKASQTYVLSFIDYIVITVFINLTFNLQQIISCIIIPPKATITNTKIIANVIPIKSKSPSPVNNKIKNPAILMIIIRTINGAKEFNPLKIPEQSCDSIVEIGDDTILKTCPEVNVALKF